MVEEYISREGISKALEKMEIVGPLYYGIPVVEALDAIENMPAADVRTVVLCRDCSYADYSGMGNGTVWCMKMERAMQETDFCSRGKREES